MTEDACILTAEHRRCGEAQIAETCAHRKWVLHAVNCRCNHAHAVVSADVSSPKKVRIDLKTWTTRALKSKFNQNRENWWAERGDIRFLNTDEELQRAVEYVRDGQDFGR
jgi:REP element-mobilizing transposase RayT